MARFKTPAQSWAHSKQILDYIYEHDSFLDNLSTIADMGCGAGKELEWWATLYTRDDPPEPRNYTCYGVDRNLDLIERDVLTLPNVKTMLGDFENPMLPELVDFMWCHDSFQYVTNPLNTLRIWNESMNVNGMLLISVPQFESYEYNRLVNRSYNHCLYNYTALNLMYMLALSGFDCRESFFFKDTHNPWITAAVYKSTVAPMDPKSVGWMELGALGLVNDSVINSFAKHGHVRQEDLLFRWLDGNWTFIRD
jgi:trans-aconitate methyltransferase